MNYRKNFLMFFLLVFSCVASKRTSIPDWVIKGTEIFHEPNKVYGIGICSPMKNKIAQIESAKVRARADIASKLAVHIRKEVFDFMQEHKEWFNLADRTKSEEFIQVVTKQIVEETLVGSKEVDRWFDKKTGYLYLLFVINLDQQVYSKYTQVFKKMAEQKHPIFVEKKLKEISDELETELELFRKRKSTQ